MTQLNWTLDELKHQLNIHEKIKGWIITEEYIHRRERYFLGENSQLAIDQDRNVHTKSTQVRIFVKLTDPARQGEISKKFFSALPLKSQLESAVEAALHTDYQAWDLPKLPASQEIPSITTLDPKMAEDIDQAMEECTSRISSCVQKKRNTLFNSAELFMAIHQRELHLSNGLTHRSAQTRIYTESAFSYSKRLKDGKIHSDEYMSTQWAVHRDHLPIEALFDESSERAEHSLHVIKPQPGKYSVIIDSEVLLTLLRGYLSQLRAAYSYHGLPFIKEGSEFIPEATGDLLTITLDPTLNYGASSTSISNQGIIQKPLSVVTQNKVTSNLVDQQYGHYMKLEPTSTEGNIVIEAGTLSYQELTGHSPQVLEILQFSGLFADPHSGTFSSEIRLAKLHDRKNQTVTYIKGGSLSGSIRENFKGLKLSKSTVMRSHFSSEQSHGDGYLGPEYALITDVSIVG